jgi:molybdopterin converting factor small subunit
MPETPSVTVRVIAFLDAFCKQNGLPSTLSVRVPNAGITARELAVSIGLPVERIEGIFHNYSVADLGALVKPGDRVAFVPPGTPASHAAFFGPFVTRA